MAKPLPEKPEKSAKIVRILPTPGDFTPQYYLISGQNFWICRFFKQD